MMMNELLFLSLYLLAILSFGIDHLGQPYLFFSSKTKLKKYFWKKYLVKYIYEIFIILAYLSAQPLRIFSSKTNLFFEGRRNALKILREEVNPSDKNIWFHVASLGEFEIAKTHN